MDILNGILILYSFIAVINKSLFVLANIVVLGYIIFVISYPVILYTCPGYCTPANMKLSDCSWLVNPIIFWAHL